MVLYLIVSTFLALVTVFCSVHSLSECPTDSLTSYQLTVYTFWSQQAFPKHFPDTRPVAQWSKLYGVSHTDKLTLFQVGALAGDSLQQYAELGRTDQFELTLNHSHVLSQFYAPPIRQGVGVTRTSFFVDKEHSRVSFVMKIHPSPDWFIGLDRQSLCPNGTWLEKLTIDATPMDAGTDQGFTFTAPDYSNDEPEPVFTISSSYPREPYGSFYYRNLTALPTMAQFVINKVQEYVKKPEKNKQSLDQCSDIAATLQTITKTLLSSEPQTKLGTNDTNFERSRVMGPINEKNFQNDTLADKHNTTKDNEGDMKTYSNNSNGAISEMPTNYSTIALHQYQINNLTHWIGSVLIPLQHLLSQRSSNTSLEAFTRSSSETSAEFQKRTLKSEIKRNLDSITMEMQTLQMLRKILETEKVETNTLEKTKVSKDGKREKEKNDSKENKKEEKNKTQSKERTGNKKSKTNNEQTKLNNKDTNQENRKNVSKIKSDRKKKRHDKSNHKKRTIYSPLWIS